MFIDFREEGKEREKETPCERETSISCLPYMPRPKINPTNFWCTGPLSYHLCHLARAEVLFKRYFWFKYTN